MDTDYQDLQRKFINFQWTLKQNDLEQKQLKVNQLQLQVKQEKMLGRKKLLEKELENLEFQRDLYKTNIAKLEKSIELNYRLNHLLGNKMGSLMLEELDRVEAQYQHVIEYFEEKEAWGEEEQNKILKFMETNFSAEQIRDVREFIERSDKEIEYEIELCKQKFKEELNAEFTLNETFNHSVFSDTQKQSQSQNRTAAIKPSMNYDVCKENDELNGQILEKESRKMSTKDKNDNSELTTEIKLANKQNENKSSKRCQQLSPDFDKNLENFKLKKQCIQTDYQQHQIDFYNNNSDNNQNLKLENKNSDKPALTKNKTNDNNQWQLQCQTTDDLNMEEANSDGKDPFGSKNNSFASVNFNFNEIASNNVGISLFGENDNPINSGSNNGNHLDIAMSFDFAKFDNDDNEAEKSFRFNF